MLGVFFLTLDLAGVRNVSTQGREDSTTMADGFDGKLFQLH
jgi:hypothetical protein